MSSSVKITVPSLGESINEATIARWTKTVGEAVAQDEVLVELETDKVMMEVNAPQAGVISDIAAPESSTVKVGQDIGSIDTAAKAKATDDTVAPAEAEADPAEAAPKEAEKPAEVAQVELDKDDAADAPDIVPTSQQFSQGDEKVPSPAARKLAADHGIALETIAGSGKDGRIMKEDILNALDKKPQLEQKPDSPPAGGKEERIRLSRLRQTIANRLKEAQNKAAILTTFNEVNMQELMNLRSRFKEEFEKKYNTRLGFMSFFVKASVEALKEIPAVNAEITDEEIIYKHYYNIGVAVSTDQGLAVPVVRNAAQKSYADIEQEITEFAQKAKAGKLAMNELQGGTFSITNGGVFGSLMSTPILNYPQAAILGMHKIEKRPIVIEDEIVIAPMMYVALSYDHRLIDGREAVTFLVRIKEYIEDPERLLLTI